jgi:hypothetical protein
MLDDDGNMLNSSHRKMAISSAYRPIVIVGIGSKNYGLPGYFLRQCPQFVHPHFWTTIIDISNIHEDAGHTFGHFLYSGSYETINSTLEEGESGITREYRQAVLAYQASRAYKLPTLEALAKRYMELFSEAMSTPEILQITREVFSELPEDAINPMIDRDLFLEQCPPWARLTRSHADGIWAAARVSRPCGQTCHR